ncbi:hypothetical protein CFP56_010093 [Quercus suber]|uniref:Uncharacterized protein n=1 Tax=Quercus suber TaxID=58331 RepID=A0AAW0L286_QUESU
MILKDFLAFTESMVLAMSERCSG